MKKKNLNLLGRKILAFALALTVGATFMPMLAGTASAADNLSGAAAAKDTSDTALMNSASAPFAAADPAAKAGPGKIEVTDMPDIDLGEIDPEDLGDIDIEELGDIVIEGDDMDGSVPESQDADDPAGELQPLPDTGSTEAITPGSSDDLEGAVKALKGAARNDSGSNPKGASDNNGGFTLTQNTSNGDITVSGAMNRGTFRVLSIIDMANTSVVYQENINSATLSKTYPLSNYPVGAYVVAVTTSVTSQPYYEAVACGIYSTPKNAASQYETYSKYLFYTPKSSVTYPKDASCGMYLDIKPKGAKNWTTYGPVNASKLDNQFKGLKPNKKYQARAYYGKYVTLDGQQFFITGVDTRKYKTVTIKTGKKKLPIKSVSVKAVNVKKHTHIIPGYVLNNVGKETWYTYRLKVTVKMKKKPGVKGIYINGKKAKGNKKTYSVKFAKQNSIMTGKWVVKPYRKYYKHTTAKIPRGTKYAVKIYSYSNKTYKAYSNIQTRKPKIH